MKVNKEQSESFLLSYLFDISIYIVSKQEEIYSQGRLTQNKLQNRTRFSCIIDENLKILEMPMENGWRKLCYIFNNFIAIRLKLWYCKCTWGCDKLFTSGIVNQITIMRVYRSITSGDDVHAAEVHRRRQIYRNTMLVYLVLILRKLSRWPVWRLTNKMWKIQISGIEK